ncbi:ABC transporter ATP-binding protein [Paenibacillus sp. L3-i20]|uniref:ABC transporter ATP-binding protein n=1 Tax=Paenibacillus sp. L3-i20 TaxID=2905833 RepID=UPI0020C16782|nr:dipeptide/oligopeptide/nickel ABC transporter ATP-binding protein [Paenibacillus sp. L3-i20]
MSMLEFKNISKSYCMKETIMAPSKSVKVVNNISLKLERGKCLGIFGRSGSGKSTLGRIIAGIEQPDCGELLFNGINMLAKTNRNNKGIRRNIGLMFQDCYSSVNPRFTTKDIVAEPLLNYEKCSSAELTKRVEKLLEVVNLSSDIMGKYPHEISGGQLQRVCIARAIALKPQLIILDEAVSSLDVLVQMQIMDLLIQLQKEFGLSYLFISHDLQTIGKLAHEIAVMDQGQIVETLQDVHALHRLSHPASRLLFDSVLPMHPGGRKKFGCFNRLELSLIMIVNYFIFSNHLVVLIT